MEIPFKIKFDKWKHLVFGFMFMWFPILLEFYGFLIALTFAIGKEVIHDKIMKKGNFEWLDFAYTMIFPTIAYVIVLFR